MVYTIVHLKLENYNQWRPVFNELASARKEMGSLGGKLFRTTDKPDEVLILMQWQDLQSAHDFCDMPDWRALMDSQCAGDAPEVIYCESVESVEA
jgi:quinol monooxygenase YgiN